VTRVVEVAKKRLVSVFADYYYQYDKNENLTSISDAFVLASGYYLS
jgi:hypothetical protein